MMALAFQAGVGPELLRTPWADDRALYMGIAEAALEQRYVEAKDHARIIRNEIADMLG